MSFEIYDGKSLRGTGKTTKPFTTLRLQGKRVIPSMTQTVTITCTTHSVPLKEGVGQETGIQHKSTFKKTKIKTKTESLHSNARDRPDHYICSTTTILNPEISSSYKSRISIILSLYSSVPEFSLRKTK